MLTVGKFLRWHFNQRTLFNVGKIVIGLLSRRKRLYVSLPPATSSTHAGFCSVRWIPEDLPRANRQPHREANRSCTSSTKVHNAFSLQLMMWLLICHNEYLYFLSTPWRGYRVFSGGKVARAWCWPPTPISAPRSWKGRAMPLLTLWASVACYRENFTLMLIELWKLVIWNLA
jgi:hypothetical protein